MQNGNGKLKIRVKRKRKKRPFVFVAVFLASVFAAQLYLQNVAVPVLYGNVEAKLTSLAAEAVGKQTFSMLGFSSYGKSCFEYAVDSDGYITSITTDGEDVNRFLSLVESCVQAKINNTGVVDVIVPVGNFLPGGIFYGKGSAVSVKIKPSGRAVCEFYSELSSFGINQAFHRLYVTVTAEYVVVMPKRKIKAKRSASYMVFENLIAGKVPNAYLPLSGSDQNLNLLP